MGLLEDAIREHLELKRLRGADPAEVAREQHEVLETPAGARTDPAAGDDAGAVPSEPDVVAPALDEGTAATSHPDGPTAAPGAESFTRVGEETAELDMEAVLGQQSPAAGEEAAPAELEEGQTSPAGITEEDSLEWEVPERSHDTGAVPPPREDDAPEHAGPEDRQANPEQADGLEDRHIRAEENAPGQGRLAF
jgi:hypothetical protein